MSARSMKRANERRLVKEAKRRRRLSSSRRAIAGAGAALGGAALLAPAAAQAAPQTFTVDSTADGAATPSNCTTPVAGACTLRDAVTAANNNNTDADTVTFASGVAPTIVLSQGQIPITDAVSIQGPGSGSLAVDGNDASRIFDVSSSPDQDVSISGLKLTHGRAIGSPGAATGGGLIYSDDADLAIASSDLSSGYAGSLGNAAAGGAIYSSGGTLGVTDSTLDHNSASGYRGCAYGGAIAVNGSPTTITGSTLSENLATRRHDGGSTRAEGGAIPAQAADLTISDATTISGNTVYSKYSYAYGGGIAFDSPSDVSGALTISDSTVSGNALTQRKRTERLELLRGRGLPRRPRLDDVGRQLDDQRKRRKRR